MPFGHGKFTSQTQLIKNYLAHLDSLGLSSVHRDGAKVNKGMVFVWLPAVVEKFWRDYISELSRRFSVAPLKSRRRSVAAASVFYFDSLSSLADAKKHRRWEKVADLFDSIVSPAALAIQSLPYDGRTVRPDHLDLVWRLFSLDGQAFPSPIHRQELNTLADRRNDVAHGHVLPGDMGGLVTIPDLRKTVERVEEIAEHCTLSAMQKWP